MVEGLRLYVEGGGDAGLLHDECRKGFRLFLERAGMKGAMPRIVACGSRNNAFERFQLALRQGLAAMLLVDSEGPVATDSPWGHLAQRDQWSKPAGAREEDCHLMVQCMESWFLADRRTLEAFFGQGFHGGSLPASATPVESVAKGEVLRALGDATRHCRSKGAYGKGRHSFDLLGRIDPERVRAASPWADRFVRELATALAR